MNKKQLEQSMALCMDLLEDQTLNEETLIFFETALKELSEEYKKLISD